MIERLRPHRSDVRAARDGLPRPPYPEARRLPTVHVPPPPGAPAAESILGFRAETDPDADPARARSENDAVRLVVRRRGDPVAGTALVLAGLAGNVSLWLPWLRDENATGFSLVRRGLSAAHSGMAELLRGGLWQPVAIVLGAGVLVVLGMLLFVPAHTHRAVGVLALVVAVIVTAAVLSLLAGWNWSTARFDAGLWTGVAVAGFGLFGAFKAMLTLPQVAPAGPDQLRR